VQFTEQFDIVIVGAGHAGCEAAVACARMGLKTALYTLNVDLIAQMSCNPAIGGIAKGHLVREVDALGGVMGEITDAVGIQFRLLNTSRGPADAIWLPPLSDSGPVRLPELVWQVRSAMASRPNHWQDVVDAVRVIVDALGVETGAVDQGLDDGGGQRRGAARLRSRQLQADKRPLRP